MLEACIVSHFNVNKLIPQFHNKPTDHQSKRLPNEEDISHICVSYTPSQEEIQARPNDLYAIHIYATL